MILNLKKYPIKVLFPLTSDYLVDTSLCSLPFSDLIIEQLAELGTFIMKSGRTFPSIVAAGYWLRKSQLLSIKSQYPVEELSAKGTVFHIAPGNVDTLFFYSMVISVLCGNQTLLRVSSKVSLETQVLLDLLNQFADEHADKKLLLSLLMVIQYQRDDSITAQISKVADARVIWGSDETIKHICQFPLANNGTYNICFPDRYSVAVIQLKDESQIEKAVDNLLRDIKPYYQQACSSPKVVYWLNTAQSLQDKFWLLLAKQLNESENLETTDLIAQLLYTQRLPLLLRTELNTEKENKNSCLFKKYDLLQVAELECITLDSIKSHSGLWVLLSLQINALDDIELFEHCQTVTVYGVEKVQLEDWKNSTKQPMKRIIPAGQALAFSHVWDGVDLVEGLTK